MADPAGSHRHPEGGGVGKRMPAAPRRPGQVAIEVDEDGRGNMPATVLVDAGGATEPPAHVEKAGRPVPAEELTQGSGMDQRSGRHAAVLG